MVLPFKDNNQPRVEIRGTVWNVPTHFFVHFRTNEN